MNLDENLDQVVDAVKDWLDDHFLASSLAKVTWNGFFAESYVLEPGSEAGKTLKDAHQSVKKEALEDQTVPAYIDAPLFSLYDKIPAMVYGPTSESTHGFDERVSIESIERVTAVMALFSAECCGLDDAA